MLSVHRGYVRFLLFMLVYYTLQYLDMRTTTKEVEFSIGRKSTTSTTIPGCGIGQTIELSSLLCKNLSVACVYESNV